MENKLYTCIWKEGNHLIISQELYLNEEDLNLKLVEGDLNLNPRRGVAHCSSSPTCTQKPIRKQAYKLEF
jgi:hypothetical protein